MHLKATEFGEISNNA